MNKYINKRHKESIYVATSDWIIKDCLFEDVKLGSDGVRKLVTQRSMGEHIREQKQLLHEGQCQQILGGVKEAGQCGWVKGSNGRNWHWRRRQGAEAQGDTGLEVGRCGKIEKSLQDFRQGSDEMEKIKLVFIQKTALAGGGAGAGWKQEGQVDHYRDPGDSIALMSDATFSVSPQTTPREWYETQGLGLGVRTVLGWLDTQVGWDDWAEWLTRADLQGYWDLKAWPWAVIARCGQLRSPWEKLSVFLRRKSFKGGNPRQPCSDWGSWPHSPGLKYF